MIGEIDLDNLYEYKGDEMAYKLYDILLQTGEYS
jgi:hypothetical protein